MPATNRIPQFFIFKMSFPKLFIKMDALILPIFKPTLFSKLTSKLASTDIFPPSGTDRLKP